jgi:hypothetical protein
MKKVRAISLLVLVFVAGLLLGLSQNVKPDQLKVYTYSGETVSVEFPDGNVYNYN